MTSEKGSINQDLFGNFEIELNIADVARGKNYEQILDSVKDLMRKPISYYYNRENERYDITTVLIYSIVHKRYSGKVTLKISSDSIPALLYLGEGFTAYNKIVALSLTSVYAKRMYELLCRWKDRGFIRMRLSEFRRMMFIDNKFKQVNELRANVLDKSMGMLKEGADYWFTYCLKKENSRAFNLIEIWIYGKGQANKHMNEYQFVYNYLYGVYSDNRSYVVAEHLLGSGLIVKAYDRFRRLDKDVRAGKVKKHGLNNYLRMILIKEFSVAEDYIEVKKADPEKVEKLMSKAKRKKERLDNKSDVKKVGDIIKDMKNKK
jgi:hypothetical protein